MKLNNDETIYALDIVVIDRETIDFFTNIKYYNFKYSLPLQKKNQ